ncbi:hypothetical protein OPS25_01515 [Alteromonas ponticola]|uniref:DUF3278 domain-containing protein n=1 Tax=Alteromonas aquimaris TaxID=2998417 RepID=A0ABT3P335_9ALTE|nr:hypothetical protein [Alteromonas aquimaris]MCW8107181.1 hypothetical protein [Alteromonas aquimaris]
MDSKLKKLQQQYQQTTPVINPDTFAKKIAHKQKVEKWLAYSEVGLGMAVSLFCLYAMVYFAESIGSQLLFGMLSPIPIGFALWSFRLRKKQWLQQCGSVDEFLNFKKQQITIRCRYWQISAWGISVIWMGLALVSGWAYSVDNNFLVWGTSLLANTPVLIITWLRYCYVKRAAQRQNITIDTFRASDE